MMSSPLSQSALATFGKLLSPVEISVLPKLILERYFSRIGQNTDQCLVVSVKFLIRVYFSPECIYFEITFISPYVGIFSLMSYFSNAPVVPFPVHRDYDQLTIPLPPALPPKRSRGVKKVTQAAYLTPYHPSINKNLRDVIR